MILLSVIISGCAGPRPISVSRRTPTIPVSSGTVATQGLDQQPSIVLEPTSAPTPNNAFAPRPTAEPATDTLPATETLLPTTELPTSIPTAISTATPAIVIIPATPSALGSEQRWRSQQVERSVMDPPRLYEARTATTLLWYDPATGQVLEIGTLRGTFPAQAQFTFRPSNTSSLEIPYRINADFGLTSISDAVRERMNRAGYDSTVEAFIYITESIVPKP